MTGTEFRQKLITGERLLGTCFTQASPHWVSIASELRLDFVFIDNEHIPLGREQTANLCRIFGGMGIPPIVRVPAPDPVLACVALDGGAWGVIAPYVETVEQVRQLVGAVKYAPLKGEVLRAGLLESKWLPETKQFLDERNAGRSVIINIESTPALERLDTLAAVPGLDAFLIGPHDLSINLGVPQQYDHPLFLESVTRIIQTARKHGIGAGVHAWWSVEQERAWLEQGLNLLIHASDYMAARVKLSDDFKKIRQHTHDN